MKLCPQCNKTQIDDKYSMCLSCLKTTQNSNKSADLNDALSKLKQINWNLGTIALTLKMGLMNQMESLKDKTPMQQKIHSVLSKKIERDLENFENIKKEQDKND